MRYFFILFFLIASPAYATTVYIDCDGANGSGTSGSPFNNFASAVTAITDGAANIIYAKGTCAEAVNLTKGGLNTSTRTVIQNWTGNLVIDGSGIAEEHGIDITSGKSYITIQTAGGYSFTIQDFEQYGLQSKTTSGVSEEVYIDGLTFTNNGTDQDGGGGAINMEYADHGRIENVAITSSYDWGIRLRYCDGDATTRWLVDTNDIDNISIVGTSYGIHAIFSTYMTISNNTVDVPAANGDLRGIFAIDSNNILIDGNTVLAATATAGANAVGIQTTTVHTATISDNIVGNWGEDCYEADLDTTGDTSYGVTFERNLGYNCVSGGIFEMADEIGTVAAPIVVRNNVAYITTAGTNCFGYHRGDTFDGNEAIHWYNNTCYVTVSGVRGFWIGKANDYPAFTDLKIQNNIGYTNNQYTLTLHGTGLTGSIADGDVANNSWYRTDSGDVIRWIGTVTTGYTVTEIEANTAYTEHLIEPAATHVSTAPTFVSAPSDLSLQAADARIDTGATLTGFSDDKIATARPQGGGWDVGAYEYLIAGPVRSNGSPSSNVNYTTTVTLSLDTAATALCKYDTSPSTAYAVMSEVITGDPGSTSHSVAGVPVSVGSNTFYVRCIDGGGYANTTDYAISFIVLSASAAHINIGTGGTVTTGTGGTITIQ